MWTWDVGVDCGFGLDVDMDVDVDTFGGSHYGWEVELDVAFLTV